MNNRDASNLIEAALQEAIVSNDGHESGDIVVDWVLIAFVTNPEQELGGGYPMFFSNGVMPDYKAKGLLIQGMSLLEDD